MKKDKERNRIIAGFRKIVKIVKYCRENNNHIECNNGICKYEKECDRIQAILGYNTQNITDEDLAMVKGLFLNVLKGMRLLRSL